MIDKSKLHFALSLISFILVVLSFVFYAIFAVEFLAAVTSEDKNLGVGIGAAISIIFMVIFDIIAVILGGIGAVYSFLMRKRADMGLRRVMKIFGVFDTVLPTLAAVSTGILFLLNNLGVFG